MVPGRVAKVLMRRSLVSWREQPSRYDIEAMQANIRRVGLVVKVRWTLVGALALFSVLAAAAYTMRVPSSAVLGNMRTPAIALGLVLLYNGFFQVTYKRLGNIAFVNHVQLLLDAVVTTVLVYYSGGVYSWFTAMYLLIILEGAFILPPRHVWPVSFACMAMYGLVVWPEYLGWLPHVEVPFVSNDLGSNISYVTVRFLWKVTVLAGAAAVGSLMMSDIRARERSLRAANIVDESTGLCNRAYFDRALADRLEHVSREGVPLAILLLDIDAMGPFNRIFGLDAGDRMLRAVASEAASIVREEAFARAWPESVFCRYGGEEFAGVLPGADKVIAAAVAERIRVAVEGLRVHDGSATVSIGIAVFPEDGAVVDDLLDAADQALSTASADAGNRVVCASDLRGETLGSHE